MANFDGTNARKIAAGVRPDISPDGTRLAFNLESAVGKPFERHIAVADLATGRITIFSSLPNNSSNGPRWSLDGRKLLFEIMDSEHWQHGVANTDGTEFEYVRVPDVTVGRLNPGAGQSMATGSIRWTSPRSVKSDWTARC